MELEYLVHNSTLLFLKQQHVCVLDQVETWKHKYSTDYGKLLAAFQLLAEERVVKLNRLMHLRERRGCELEAERSTRESFQIQSKIDRCRLVESKVKDGAASTIQLTVRSYLHWKTASHRPFKEQTPKKMGRK